MNAMATVAALLALGGTGVSFEPVCKATMLEATMVNATMIVADENATTARFRSVDGADLKGKLANAIARARSEAGGKKYYVAYGFDVRPGVAVDVEIRSQNGEIVHFNGINISTGGSVKETRNLGIFLQYGPAGDVPERVEVLNLDRAHNFEVIPVFWMGRAETKQSLDLLEGFARTRPGDIAERAALAIAIHESPAVADVLERVVRSSSSEQARRSAVIWIGELAPNLNFLETLARDSRENRELREHAILAIGISRRPESIGLLKDLYKTIPERQVREHVFVALASGGEDGENRESTESDEFLMDVARNEANRDLRRQAIFWLSQRASKKTLGAIEENLEHPDDDIQQQAVFALSQRPKDEAIPTLMRLGRDHHNPNVRKQAIFWLGQFDDDRVVEFLREIILGK